MFFLLWDLVIKNIFINIRFYPNCKSSSTSKKDLEEIEPYIKIITKEEGLINHYEAVKERVKDITNQKIKDEK